MVCSRYPITPVIIDYQQTIAEAIEAHFLGLHHVAVAGLVPVIEGAGRQLLKSRGLVGRSVKEVFSALAQDCKKQGVGQYWRGALDDGLIFSTHGQSALREF